MYHVIRILAFANSALWAMIVSGALMSSILRVSSTVLDTLCECADLGLLETHWNALGYI